MERRIMNDDDLRRWDTSTENIVYLGYPDKEKPLDEGAEMWGIVKIDTTSAANSKRGYPNGSKKKIFKWDNRKDGTYTYE